MTDRQRRLVVLDRDGVINFDSKNFIKTPSEWRPLPGSLDAIAALVKAGFEVIVATNQSGVGRGLFDTGTLDEIHRKMTESVEAVGGMLHGIFVCPHRPDEDCECRKPNPGLLRQIEKQFDCSLVDQPAIGDSTRDLEAAKSVGARPILVRTGNGAVTEKLLGQADDVPVFDDLAGAARFLIRNTG